MMAKVSALVVRSLRISSEIGSISQKGFEGDLRTLVTFRPYSQSSTSNWGSGEPPVEDTHERGVGSLEPGSAGPSAVEKPVGRQSSSPTSTSGFDTGVEQTQQQEKSRAGQHSSSGTSHSHNPVGQQRDEPSSASGPKKSRTGGDMTDEGQVHTPNLQRMRSTREIIQGQGKETERRLESEKKSV